MEECKISSYLIKWDKKKRGKKVIYFWATCTLRYIINDNGKNITPHFYGHYHTVMFKPLLPNSTSSLIIYFFPNPCVAPLNNHYCSKNAAILVQNLALAIGGADGPARLASNTASQAARTAVALTCEMDVALYYKETESESETSSVVRGGVRRNWRRRRRRKRKEIEFLGDEVEEKMVHFRPGKSGLYLSPEEVAECSWYLKVWLIGYGNCLKITLQTLFLVF